MEDNLKILKMEYLRNPWSDLPQNLNLSWGNQTKFENCLIWRQAPMIKILKVEYMSNQWLDLTKLKLMSPEQKLKIPWNEVNHQWKTTSKCQKWNISATTDPTFPKLKS